MRAPQQTSRRRVQQFMPRPMQDFHRADCPVMGDGETHRHDTLDARPPRRRGIAPMPRQPGGYAGRPARGWRRQIRGGRRICAPRRDSNGRPQRGEVRSWLRCRVPRHHAPGQPMDPRRPGGRRRPHGGRRPRQGRDPRRRRHRAGRFGRPLRHQHNLQSSRHRPGRAGMRHQQEQRDGMRRTGDPKRQRKAAQLSTQASQAGAKPGFTKR